MENRSQEKPEHPPGGSPNTYLSWNQVRSYLRELSVVIVGILITLSITSLINNRNRQNELRGMLTLVTEELKENIDQVNHALVRWSGERRAFEMLLENLDDIERIPRDTLEEYRYTIGAIHALKVKKEYYETLQSSVLTQYVKDKELLPMLSAAYNSMITLNEQLTIYSEQKIEFTFPMMRNMDSKRADMWLNGSVYDSFRIPLEDNGFRAFLVIGPTILSDGIFESCLRTLQNTIAEMERMGY